MAEIELTNAVAPNSKPLKSNWSEHEGYWLLPIPDLKFLHFPRWKISQWMALSPFTYRIAWLKLPFYIFPGNFSKTGVTIGELCFLIISILILVAKLSQGGALGGTYWYWYGGTTGL
jgi:hypothetical protein